MLDIETATERSVLPRLRLAAEEGRRSCWSCLGWPRRLVICLLLAAPGCQKSSATAPDASAPPATSVPAPAPGLSAWGVLLHVPAGFSSEQNRAAGWELTDGRVVLLLGRHDLEARAALGEFFDERRQALSQYGAAKLTPAQPRKLEHGAGLEGEGSAESEAGNVGLKLFVARIDERTGLSLLMIHDAAEKSHAKAVWQAILARSRLP